MDIVDEIRADREAGALRLEREYKPQLLAVAARFCPDPKEAESLVYRTMDETIRCIETLSNPDSFFGWMCGIMSNQYGKLNRRKIDGNLTYTDKPLEMEDESLGANMVVQAVDGTLLRDAIEHLPPKLKEAVLLRYFAEMPITQIARFLMIPVGTVNSRLHMARQALALRLGAKLKKPAVALIAAGLMLLGATAAVVVGVDALVASEMGGTRSGAPEMGGMRSDAPETGGTRSGASSEIPSDENPSTTDGQQPTFSNQLESQEQQGEKTMNIKQKAALTAAAVAVAGLAPPAAAGVTSATSSAMASFSSFVANSAQTPTSLEGGFHSFVSQSVDTDTLPQFNSREPRGTKIILR